MKKLLLVVALVLGFGSVSQAGLLLEPYLGYEFGKTKDPAGDFNGTLLGARVAWTAPVFFWLGADVAMSVSEKWKPDGLESTDAKRTTVGAVVGVDFPILVRAWLSYGLLNDLKLDLATYKGTQTKLGVGFTGLPFISINLEMIQDKWDKADSVTLSPEVKTDTYVLSVSLPLEF